LFPCTFFFKPDISAWHKPPRHQKPDARSKSIDTHLQQETRAAEDKIVTQLIPFGYADAAEIKRLFRPMVSKSSIILAYAPKNTLIITDVYSNIKRLMRILSLPSSDAAACRPF
jgi:type II secretory pathway component GspD/PulD (secretin)